MPPALPHIKTGKVRAVAVTSAKRSAALPEVPTVAESGVPGYEAIAWQGLVAPAATPKPVIARIHAEFVKALKLPDVAEGQRPFDNRRRLRGFAEFLENRRFGRKRGK